MVPATKEKVHGDGMSNETELKLQLPPTLHGVDSHQLLTRLKPNLRSRGIKKILRNVYFDTAERDLAKRGMALRVREIGRKRIQTLKVPNGGTLGLQSYRELEAELPSDMPSLAKISDRTLARELRAEVWPRLQPVFFTNFERTSWTLPYRTLGDRGVVGSRQHPRRRPRRGDPRAGDRAEGRRPGRPVGRGGGIAGYRAVPPRPRHQGGARLCARRCFHRAAAEGDAGQADRRGHRRGRVREDRDQLHRPDAGERGRHAGDRRGRGDPPVPRRAASLARDRRRLSRADRRHRPRRLVDRSALGAAGLRPGARPGRAGAGDAVADVLAPAAR